MRWRIGLILAAALLASAFQQSPTHLPRPRQPTITPGQVQQPSPIVPEEAARGLRLQIGPWLARCRPGPDMRLIIDDMSNVDARWVSEVQAAWKLELALVRAPSGYNQRALQPGECALADSALPGDARNIRLVRLLEAAGTPYARTPREALREFEFTPNRTELHIRSADRIFNAVAWRAAIGSRGTGMIDTYSVSGRRPAYAPFDVMLIQCDARCARGRGSTAGVFYIQDHIQEQRG